MERLSVKCTEKWFEQLPDVKFEREVQPPDLILSLKAEAENLWDSESRLYNRLKENKRDKDFVWIKKILQTGTLSDKVSAHTLLIQDCAVYNVKSIESLIAMVNTKGKRECLMALDALLDLFCNILLIEHRKLKPFSEQPLKQLDSITKSSPVLRKRILILWLFEDMLKKLYKNFLNNLDSVSRDTVDKTKQKAVTVMYHLLQEIPEEEQFLLEHLVNKIGDPIAKIGSHVCFLLGQLIVRHPNMKAIVVQEVERLIFRPNLAERAKYYALCFLNQVILSHEESNLANHLIMIYFSQFKTLFVKKGEVDTKMMSALLTGIARAYPFANLKDNVIMDRLDAMYRLVHMVSFNISIQALMLIFQVLDSKDSVSDRFYNVLYRKLFDPALSSSSRQAALLNLLYRAMKKDVAVVRVRAFVKRLLQVALCQAPNLQCGILMLISEINKIHPDILETVPSFQSDSDSDEHYSDISDETEANPRPEGEQDKIISDSKPNIGSWVHRKQRTNKENSKSAYDVNCRNPLHARAECAHLWELLFLKDSFHPSVSLFAHQICNSNEIKYNGDPLIDFTVARFLDRFVYRNPKKLCDSQLNTHTKVFGSRKLKAKSSKLLPVNSEEYLQQNEEKVPAEERFIYQYLHKRATSGKSSKQDSDIESVCSEDFQKLIDNMHTEDEGKNSLNFAKELGLNKGKKPAKRKADINSDSDIDLEDESEVEDIEFEDEEFQNSFADLEDMEAAEFCEEDFIDQDILGKPNTKRAKKKGKNSKCLTDGKLLASADEFSALLEDNAGSTVDTLSGEALRNQDKSGAKQLAWEIERDRFVRGAKWQNKKKFGKKKKFKK